MSRRHALLGLLVVVIWGVNFVVIDGGLGSFPPLLFAALRFTFVAFPAILFVRAPSRNRGGIVAVGLLQGVGQFGLLFVGMHLGVSAGLASLVLQGQAAFTVLFAVLVLHERPGRVVYGGVLAGLAGLLIIAFGDDAAPLGALLIVGAGACWAAANIATKLTRPSSGFALTVWSAAVAPVPLLVLSLIFEGPGRDWSAVTGADAAGIGDLAFTVVLSTLVAFGAWASLLKSNSPTVVGSFSLLVPVVGVVTAWLVLHEVPGPVELGGGVLILLGVACVLRPDLPGAAMAVPRRLIRPRLAAPPAGRIEP